MSSSSWPRSFLLPNKTRSIPKHSCVYCIHTTQHKLVFLFFLLARVSQSVCHRDLRGHAEFIRGRGEGRRTKYEARLPLTNVSTAPSIKHDASAFFLWGSFLWVVCYFRHHCMSNMSLNYKFLLSFGPRGGGAAPPPRPIT